MGMDLKGKQGYFRFTLHEWNHVIRLGVHYKWQPMGTRPGSDQLRRFRYAARRAGQKPPQVDASVRRFIDGYHGDYCFNEQQAVTAKDAANLANALEQALADTPSTDLLKRTTKEMKEFTRRTGRSAPKRMYDAMFGQTPQGALNYFGGNDGRRVLKEFIAYCRGGRFEIS